MRPPPHPHLAILSNVFENVFPLAFLLCNSSSAVGQGYLEQKSCAYQAVDSWGKWRREQGSQHLLFNCFPTRLSPLWHSDVPEVRYKHIFLFICCWMHVKTLNSMIHLPHPSYLAIKEFTILQPICNTIHWSVSYLWSSYSVPSTGLGCWLIYRRVQGMEVTFHHSHPGPGVEPTTVQLTDG